MFFLGGFIFAPKVDVRHHPAPSAREHLAVLLSRMVEASTHQCINNASTGPETHRQTGLSAEIHALEMSNGSHHPGSGKNSHCH